MVHIGYGDSARGCLREAMENHGLEGERTIPSRDDFTQGPISHCVVGSDFLQRKEYWTKIQSELGIDMEVDDFYEESLAMIDELVNTDVVIWQGDSAHDILATAWLMTYLDGKEIKWHIIDLGMISPSDLNQGLPAANAAMFSPEEIAGLYRYKQSMGQEAIGIYQDLWSYMAEENAAFRIKNDNQLLSVSEDYHDEFILNNIKENWVLAAGSIGDIMEKSYHSLSDTTVEYRIRQLIKSGKIEYKGELTDVKSYEVKRGI